MKRLRALVYGIGLAGLVAVLTPIWMTHHLATRIIGSRRRGSTIDIERIDAASASLDEVLAAGQPVVLEGLVGELGLSHVATPDSQPGRSLPAFDVRAGSKYTDQSPLEFF